MSSPPPDALGVEEVGEALRRFHRLIGRIDPEVEVACCPGWRIADVVIHLGNVHAWAATIVETGAQAPFPDDVPSSRRTSDLGDWYAAKAEDLFAVLKMSDPQTPCWTFLGDQRTAAFWVRRQWHETTVHAVDLRFSGAPPTPDDAHELQHGLGLSAAACGDGIDEVLRVFSRRMHQRGQPLALSHPIVIEAADLGRRWSVAPAKSYLGQPPGAPIVVDGGLPRADRISGSSTDLYLGFWGRVPLQNVVGDGDPERIAAFLNSALTP